MHSSFSHSPFIASAAILTTYVDIIVDCVEIFRFYLDVMTCICTLDNCVVTVFITVGGLYNSVCRIYDIAVNCILSNLNLYSDIPCRHLYLST